MPPRRLRTECEPHDAQEGIVFVWGRSGSGSSVSSYGARCRMSGAQNRRCGRRSVGEGESASCASTEKSERAVANEVVGGLVTGPAGGVTRVWAHAVWRSGVSSGAGAFMM